MVADRALTAGVPCSLDSDVLEADEAVRDDQLRLIFTCCHPSLRPDHQVALTLRLLGGLSVEEVGAGGDHHGSDCPG